MTPSPGHDLAGAPLGRGVRVLAHHACGLFALEKPAETLSHPNKPGEEDRSLLNARFEEKKECYRWTGAEGLERKAWLLHRLDAATSGIVLVAADAAVAVAVRDAFEQRHVHKRYVAIVLGHPRERQAIWCDTMQVRRAGGVVRAAGARGGIPAEAAMKCLRLIPGPPALAVIELEPRTGRTHQLRHQCAERHLPILGDQTYGNFRLNRELARRFETDRLFLHAHEVRLEFKLAGKVVSFSASSPLPGEFERFLGRR